MIEYFAKIRIDFSDEEKRFGYRYEKFEAANYELAKKILDMKTRELLKNGERSFIIFLSEIEDAEFRAVT